MVWKILTGLLTAGLLVILLGGYIPELKGSKKKSDTENVALQQQVQAMADQQKILMGQVGALTGVVSQVKRDQERQDDRRASVRPNIQLEVKGLNADQQRLDVIESLIRNKLLKLPEGTVVNPSIIYTDQATEALAVSSRECDSVRVSDQTARLALSVSEAINRQQADTLSRYRNWAEQGAQIAREKGIFNGRNRRLRDHTLSAPVR